MRGWTLRGRIGAAIGMAVMSSSSTVAVSRSIMDTTSRSTVNVNCTGDRDRYAPGDTARITCLGNFGQNQSIQILPLNNVSISNPHPLIEAVAPTAARSTTFEWTISPDAESVGAYAITLGPQGARPYVTSSAVSFLRVASPDQLTTFRFEPHSVEGKAVLALDGGLSAEFAIEKAVGNLTGLNSHSWYVSRPGHGPNPVMATPDFLANAIKATVRAYDDRLGSRKTYDTVIVSTGFPAVPYLSQALNAPVLPLHFLASADSVTEIKGVLTGAQHAGYSAYATLGHDLSIDHSVAWIKLLDLPAEYRDFIVRHRVKRVILMGSTGVTDGETKARRLGGDARAVYRPGEVYIMYPGTSIDDQEALASKIVDLSATPNLSDFVKIADWESGVAPSQVCRIGRSVRRAGHGSVQALALTPESLGNLYDLASTATIALMAKNRRLYRDPRIAASGIVLNPYLASYPGAEFMRGYVPLVYFQVVPASETLRRIDTVIRPALRHYFPGVDPKNSRIWINSTKNFGGSFFATPYEAELAKLGYNSIQKNDYSVDEHWSYPGAPLSVPEVLLRDDEQRAPGDRLADWSRRRVPLTISELRVALSFFPKAHLRDIGRCNQASE